MALAQAPALRIEDFPGLRNRHVSFPAAHRELTRLRDLTRGTDTVRMDLTNIDVGEPFDWRGWVANRDDAAQLVGPGVWAFWFVRLTTRDSNLDEPRADFLLRRVDGQDVRLHPQTTVHKVTRRKEANPVWGNWEAQWHPSTPLSAQNDALASTRGQSSHSAFVGMSRADAVGAREACAYLDRKLQEWTERPHPRGLFREDITEGGAFLWPFYVQGRAWYGLLGDHNITRFEVAWHDTLETPVFVGALADGNLFHIHPRARTQRQEFRWGTDGVSAM